MTEPYYLAPFVRAFFEDHLVCRRNVSGRNRAGRSVDGVSNQAARYASTPAPVVTPIATATMRTSVTSMFQRAAMPAQTPPIIRPRRSPRSRAVRSP